MGWYLYAAGDHVRTSSMRATISCAILGCSLESIWARRTEIRPELTPRPAQG